MQRTPIIPVFCNTFFSGSPVVKISHDRVDNVASRKTCQHIHKGIASTQRTVLVYRVHPRSAWLLCHISVAVRWRYRTLFCCVDFFCCMFSLRFHFGDFYRIWRHFPADKLSIRGGGWYCLYIRFAAFV